MIHRRGEAGVAGRSHMVAVMGMEGDSSASTKVLVVKAAASTTFLVQSSMAILGILIRVITKEATDKVMDMAGIKVTASLLIIEILEVKVVTMVVVDGTSLSIGPRLQEKGTRNHRLLFPRLMWLKVILLHLLLRLLYRPRQMPLNPSCLKMPHSAKLMLLRRQILLKKQKREVFQM
jgi:hypothetical protein